jgi:hypothetical protein
VQTGIVFRIRSAASRDSVDDNLAYIPQASKSGAVLLLTGVIETPCANWAIIARIRDGVWAN